MNGLPLLLCLFAAIVGVGVASLTWLLREVDKEARAGRLPRTRTSEKNRRG